METIITTPEFRPFPKMARLSRECIITEKIDGTNAQITITDSGEFLIGSRSRWITPAQDNHGFARWAIENKEELMKLGPGSHFGEWWGPGIQRGYGLAEKRFSLFNVFRWSPEFNDPKLEPIRPACIHTIPVLYRGPFDTLAVQRALAELQIHGSFASPGFMRPEGVVVFHTAGNVGFKKTIEKDEEPKSKNMASR